MPSDSLFVSFGGNAEDVVLHRALGDLTDGRYVEVGAASPTYPSVTRAFYERGWNGVVVVPTAEAAQAFRRHRPRDLVVAADGSRPLDAVLDEQVQPGEDVQVLVCHTRGVQDPVPADSLLRLWRPWVMVVSGSPSTPPAPPRESEEELIHEARYELCLFDGVSRFYVAVEHADRLRAPLAVAANVLDAFVPHRWSVLERELATAREEAAALRDARDEALAEVDRWRGEALSRWANVVSAPPDASAGRGSHEIVRLKAELAALQSTVSWRVTAPLRALQQRRLREWR